MINIKDNELNEIVDLIKEKYGINLSEKRNLIEVRLHNILSTKGISNFSEYINIIKKDHSKAELTTLVNKLTTNHTFFMREAEHFSYFSSMVLPYMKANIKEKDLRVWCAGCSTGEEPYTLAMLISDCFSNEKLNWDTKILATDISVRALEHAERGIYASDELEALTDVWKLKYFESIDSQHFKVNKNIQDEIIFRVFNLMDAFPFKKKFHTIFCRNVMIYFDNKTKIDLINKFYDITEPGGYFFIGHSETINKEETRYNYIMPSVYRKG